MALKWSEKLLTGYDIIDSQHRDIFAAAKKVLNHNRISLNFILLFEDMDNFRNKVLENFAAEEGLMTTLSTVIPWKVMEKHRAAHRKIIARMDKALTKSSTFDQMLEVIHYIINDWIPGHTQEHDKVLARNVDT